ncbi:unnamed protein product [Peniophora sp. CBMAI 1063]|nr:unnamed protein product [Peniophora sp. CBMAI 1063]
MSLNFSKHELIEAQCVPFSPITRSVNIDGNPVGKGRLIKPGSLVVLEPTPAVNAAGDDVWFAVVTWVEPEDEVKSGCPQLCEVFWVYTKLDMIRLLDSGAMKASRRFRKALNRCSDQEAWITGHYSDEPVDAILSVPTFRETRERIKLSAKEYIRFDSDSAVCEFVTTA